MNLAPNGKPSNLNSEQYELVRTPEFKAWFGDWENDSQNASKVVDDNGEPMVVYHGTYAKEKFNIFDFSKADLGFHFGTYEQAKDRSLTKFAMKEHKQFIEPFFLNIRQLFLIEDAFMFEYPQSYIGDLVEKRILTKGEVSENSLRGLEIKQSNQIVRNILVEKYKNVGFKYHNKLEGEGYSYIVCEPNQMKLADGSNTTFDSNNPDIRYAKGGRTIAQTPAPKSDRVHGSSTNKKGSASTEGKGIELSEKTIGTLKKKLEEFKKSYPNLENVSLSDLKKVYRRGSGAYSSSHRPTITGGAPNSRAAWSFARVNKFLEKAAGKKVKKAYVQDDDLLKYADGGLTAKETIQSLPTELRERYLKLWDIPQRKGYHPEGNTLKHAVVVLNRAIKKYPNDKDIIAAALFHDIGKDKVFAYHKTTGEPTAYGHEEVSAELVIEYQDWVSDFGADVDCVYFLVKNHMKAHKLNEMRQSKQDAIKASPYYDKLMKLESIDKGGIEYAEGGEITSNLLKVGDKVKLRRLPIYARRDTGYGQQRESIKVIKKIRFVNETDIDPLDFQGATKRTEIFADTKDVKSIIFTFHDNDLINATTDNARYEIVYEVGGIQKNYKEISQNNTYMKKGGELNPDNNSVKNYFAHDSGNAGGVLVGQRHSEGGIKAMNKGTGQPIEMEGGEVVITRNAVSDNSKREFDGQMLTNKQILSKINESGGGVSFADGGDVPESIMVSGREYSYGGKTMKDSDIVSSCGCKHSMAEGGETNSRQAYYATLSNKCYEDGGELDTEDFNDTEKYVLNNLKLSIHGLIKLNRTHAHKLENIENKGLIYITQSDSHGCKDVKLTDYGIEVVRSMGDMQFKDGGSLEMDCGCKEYKSGGTTDVDTKYYKGTKHEYDNQFQINKAIEELITDIEPKNLTPEEKQFISYYAGYGGLEKFGASGKGLLYEYFTPSEIAKKMWGLAYKHGFKGGRVLEPSCGIGEFIKYAPDQNIVTGYEINEFSAKICSILYPNATIESKYFETLFIKNNDSIRDKTKDLKKYSLVIGNPPYGTMGGIYAGLGEKSYTKANNYIDYFILRGLDLLESNGLLIYIIGTEVAAGGVPFLQQGMNAVKQNIALKADIVDAYRLPNGLFETTDVLTDIIVFKKK